jgi:hypothetical protein
MDVVLKLEMCHQPGAWSHATKYYISMAGDVIRVLRRLRKAGQENGSTVLTGRRWPCPFETCTDWGVGV